MVGGVVETAHRKEEWVCAWVILCLSGKRGTESQTIWAWVQERSLGHTAQRSKSALLTNLQGILAP